MWLPRRSSWPWTSRCTLFSLSTLCSTGAGPVQHAASTTARYGVHVRVDIWSDMVCPWCYIGKRRFETALARFAHRDQVQVVWHSFELDPRATASPAGSIPDR